MTHFNSSVSRRKFLQTSATAAVAIPSLATAAQSPADAPSFSSLKPLGDRALPIPAEELKERTHKAQSLLQQVDPKLDALVIGPGTSLVYFTGVHWWPSERLLAFVVPKSGSPFFVVPAFEEARLRESMHYPADVRTWQEDESPTKLLATTLADRGLRTGRIGIEEAFIFTFYDHLREAAPAYEFVSGDPITHTCRSVKSARELQLQRLACEATCNVYREIFVALKEGMTERDITSLISAGYAKMNLRGDALVLIGTSAALPHGSKQPQKLKEGDVVLLDGGCLVEGYGSDVSRTGVLGKPSEKAQRAFETVRKAQNAALDAARAGRLSGSVDDAARSVVTAAGFGPDYKYFAHRLGHGIGLDGHEWPYLVRGSKTVLAPGMTFSNEPGIYIPGEFGIRCEEVMAITPDGPAALLTPGFQPSLEKPMG